jgi:cell division protein FtsB
MDKQKQKTTQKQTCEELKKENEALKQRVKELEKRLATYNMHFASGKVK